MVGLSRDYLALYVELLRWLLTQQLEYALTKHGLTLPAIDHHPSVKAEWMAATAFSSGIRRSRGAAKIVVGGKHTHKDGAAL